MRCLLVLAVVWAAVVQTGGQLTGNVIDYAHTDCTNRPELDVHSNPYSYSFSFDAHQVEGHICMMTIATPIGMSYIRNIVTELDYSLQDADIDQTSTDLIVMQQFNLSDTETANAAVPSHLVIKPAIGPASMSAQCYFPFQCMPCTGLCALSVSNWCRTNSLCSMVSPGCAAACVDTCVKYYSCTCPQSSQTIGCPRVHTLRLEQPIVLATNALVNGAPERADQIVTWCLPSAQAALVRLYVKNFIGHILHCAQFVAKFG